MKGLLGIDADNESYKFSKAFIAIAAPSLEGKTQFAFLLKRIRPLYFALGAKSDSDPDTTVANQPIYLNFKDLNRTIEEFAKYDLKVICRNSRTELEQLIKTRRKEGLIKKGQSGIFYRITTGELSEHQGNVKLFTLGLLYYLVEDARNNYDRLDATTRPSWLEYHSNRSDFEVVQKSISEIPYKYFDGYCLFLDEFKGTDWAVYIRNLARCLGIRCAVANTNASIANLVGKNGSHMSGIAGKYIWSIVVTELKLGNYETLNSRTNIEENINWICNNAISNEFIDDVKLCHQFFNDFKSNQVQNLRPGLALAAANLISKFRTECQSLNSKRTFEDFLNYLVNGLSETLSERKEEFFQSITAQAANLNMILSAAYDRHRYGQSLSRYCNFLESHYYYLINPSNPENWLFLTLASKGAAIPLKYYDEKKKQLIPWVAELTFFKSEELLSILACFGLFSPNRSFKSSLNLAYTLSATLNYDTENVGNPLAQKREGNRLEVLSTLCCSHSTHHIPDSNVNSHSGQSGTNFFKNLFANLFYEFEDGFKFPVNFNFQSVASQFNVQSFLNYVRIPYLWVSNMELPSIFCNMMNGSKPENRSINIAKIKRTADKSKIDIQFPFYYPAVDSTTLTTFLYTFKCNIECKNWKNNVLYSDLMSILKRSRNSIARLNIIICNKFGKATDATAKDFNDFCREKGINAYRFECFSNAENFMSKNYRALLINDVATSTPEMIAFVIELAVINST